MAMYVKLPNGADVCEGQKVFPFTKFKVVTGISDNNIDNKVDFFFFF